MLAANVLLAAMALALQVAAVPGPRRSGLQLKRQTCSAEFAELVVEGNCEAGQNACEFCCPNGFDVPSATGLDCHLGHEPFQCAAGYTEWHCGDH
ncbi:hypothetical protein MFIFM68171_07681 [Madurella fahalii]|uniref:Uncharacterized protein n=1 Tax=Madurella fahalii TaxID=1157608 RepID=A0ABQ0GI82_9PEZI